MGGEAAGVREVGEGAEFGGRVERAVLGGLSDGDGSGFGKVNAVTADESGGDGGGGEFAEGAGEREEFAAAGEKFGGAAFVGVNVGDLVAEDALVAVAEGGEGEGVGGGAVEDEEGFAVGFEDLPEELLRAGGRGIVTVGGDGVGIGGVERGEGFRADAGGVVAGERGIVTGGHGERVGGAAKEGDDFFRGFGTRRAHVRRNAAEHEHRRRFERNTRRAHAGGKNLRAASLLTALFREAGWEMVVVGGSAIEFYTEGDYFKAIWICVGRRARGRCRRESRRR